MALTPFDKSYQISKQDTIDRLESASINVNPITINKDEILERHKRNELHFFELIRKLPH